MVKSSSDMESTNIKADSGSSQEPLIESDVPQKSSNSSSDLEKTNNEMLQKTEMFDHSDKASHD